MHVTGRPWLLFTASHGVGGWPGNDPRQRTCNGALLSKLDPSLPEAMQPTDAELANTWIERNDAQNYVLIGDPAVRLRASELK
jgi:hypothetical protein